MPHAQTAPSPQPGESGRARVLAAGIPAARVLAVRVVDYEPSPVSGEQRAAPRPSGVRRRPPVATPRPVDVPTAPEPVPPQAAAFAEAALRRILEVTDRRRPAAALRAVLAPHLVDPVVAGIRTAHTSPAVLRRVRARTAGGAGCPANGAGARPVPPVEVFATYTRGERLRVIAGRVEHRDGRWLLVALQIG